MTLKAIAQAAGVSVSTVSRVLNDKGGACASEEVRVRVWTAARTLGYRPNDHARRLRAGGEGVDERPRVAVVLARIRDLTDDPFFSELTRSVEIELLRQGAHLTEILYAPGTLPAFDAPDALLVLGRCSQALLAKLKQVTGNLVGIWRNPQNFDVDEVVCDGEKAAALATERLIELKHKKIAYIGDCSYERRYVGYCQTLMGHNLPLDYNLVAPTDQTRKAGAEAMRRIMEGGEATAVLCANDITAVGALEAMAEKRKGRRLSVISIDNIAQAQSTKPLLTTVNIPREDMAHMAVSVLLDRIKGGHQEYVRVELPCRIVCRDSAFGVT